MDTLGAAQLAAWGISEPDATAAGIFFTPNTQVIYEEMPPRPGLVIPYYLPTRHLRTFNRNGVLLPYARIRLLGADPSQRHRFVKSKPLRYVQPSHTPVAPYFWPGQDWGLVLQDTTVPLVITEGEAKAIVGCIAGFTVLALGGVYSFTDRSGEMLQELDQVAWSGRDVFIVYDSDAATNPNVLAAEARLVDELQRKRGAKCRVVRLPPHGDDKQGLDDYIKRSGPADFADLLQQSPTMGALDAKILGLNQHVAWIERENMIYDLHSKLFIPKDAFINGSKYSAEKHITVSATSRAVKEVSVAQKWLTHSHAQRFDEVLFRPNEPVTLRGDHNRMALNIWSGFNPEVGDITPFLELNTHLYKNVHPNDRDLPLKLMIYKAQNPAQKIPLALVLVGPEGSGKTMWSEVMRDAFAPYGVDVPPSALSGDFQGWLETSLLCVVNEAKGDDMRKASERLRGLVSELKQMMNEKFRPARQIDAYASYIITANDRSVGAFRVDDRRMIVVSAPKPDKTGLYDRVVNWRARGGAKALLGWMLEYDLQGWKPPERAPLSAEKYLAYIESLTPTQRLAEEMQTAGQDTIKLWLDAAVQWARTAELGNNPQMAQVARATLDSITQYQIRPWYQPEELAMMFPSIVTQLLGSKFSTYTPAGQISRELREAGVPYLVCADDPRGFLWRGRMCQFLVVSQFNEWTEPLRQNDFDRLMKQWPTYGQLTGRGLR